MLLQFNAILINQNNVTCAKFVDETTYLNGKARSENRLIRWVELESNLTDSPQCARVDASFLYCRQPLGPRSIMSSALVIEVNAGPNSCNV